CADVLLAIASHVALTGEPTARVSYDTIADEALVSRRSAVNGVQALATLGLIKIIRCERNRCNVYRFQVHEILTGTPSGEDGAADVHPAQKSKSNPSAKFEVVDYVDALTESLGGLPVEEVRAVVRWNVLDRTDPFWRVTCPPASPSALATLLPRMIAQYREHRSKTPVTTPPPRPVAASEEYRPAYHGRKGQKV